MKDKSKTKDQLIAELKAAYERIAYLEQTKSADLSSCGIFSLFRGEKHRPEGLSGSTRHFKPTFGTFSPLF